MNLNKPNIKIPSQLSFAMKQEDDYIYLKSFMTMEKRIFAKTMHGWRE